MRKEPNNSCGMILRQIEILKYGYKTSEKKPFHLQDSNQVSLTHLTLTPEMNAWFTNDDYQTHCNTLTQNLHKFPIKSSEKWLNENFCHFQKFANGNELTYVKVHTNMWLQDGNQHSFPVSTPEDKILPSAKAQLDKDFEYEELNWEYKD